MSQQEQFEAWWNRRHSQYTCFLCKDNEGNYIYLHASLAWQAWQEALASHAPSEAAAQPTSGWCCKGVKTDDPAVDQHEPHCIYHSSNFKAVASPPEIEHNDH